MWEEWKPKDLQNGQDDEHLEDVLEEQATSWSRNWSIRSIL